jgi:hypothetical protein
MLESTASVALNDLWEYFPSSNEWAWIGGAIPPPITSTANCVPPGVYDTLGTPDAANIPAGRYGASSWTDNNGNLWLFAGLGGEYENTGLNDLMEFVPSADEWTWKGGSDPTSQSNTGASGIYGTLGVYAAGNIPGGRVRASCWTDSGGNFWLLGGTVILPVSGEFSTENDLWEFSPSMNMWAWMGGQNAPSNCTTFQGQGDCSGNTGVYGTLGVPAAGNIPGARSNASAWTDKSNHPWLFGGDGFNDLWVFEPAANEWGWMGGTNPETSSQSPQPGVYGTLGVPATGNVPGGRNQAATWTDRSGNFWLFGGNNAPNDLWVYEAQASAATPAFSVAAGTYTAIQNVTITDPTANAVVYYTTDGSEPTTGSTVYSGPITVASTETLPAVAVATNALSSAVASAAYTINVVPPDFSIAGSPGSGHRGRKRDGYHFGVSAGWICFGCHVHLFGIACWSLVQLLSSKRDSTRHGVHNRHGHNLGGNSKPSSQVEPDASRHHTGNRSLLPWVEEAAALSTFVADDSERGLIGLAQRLRRRVVIDSCARHFDGDRRCNFGIALALDDDLPHGELKRRTR